MDRNRNASTQAVDTTLNSIRFGLDNPVPQCDDKVLTRSEKFSSYRGVQHSLVSGEITLFCFTKESTFIVVLLKGSFFAMTKGRHQRGSIISIGRIDEKFNKKGMTFQKTCVIPNVVSWSVIERG